MGIFIYLNISQSVTAEEWKEVYEETLALMNYFPFAERRTVKIHDIDTICLVPSEERVEDYTKFGGKKSIGWHATGNFDDLSEAEDYYLPRNLVSESSYDPDAGDALYSVVARYLDYDWDEERFNRYYSLWGGKTQGETYHIYLLAIGCLIADRLGEKVYLHGDITRGQCKKAVELVNEAVELLEDSLDPIMQKLKKPISLPDQCDKDRLFKRISMMDISEYDKARFFDLLYLGTKDKDYGAFFLSSFAEDAITAYWEKSFVDVHFGSIRFHEIFKNYLIWGNELEQIFRYISFDEEHNTYEEFVKCIMDTKLHQPIKDCRDILAIDQEESHPYSIWTLLAQFSYAGARNKKVDRYIPIEQIRHILKKHIGDKCNVDELIDAYLERESQQKSLDLENEVSPDEFKSIAREDPAKTFNQIVDMRKDKMEEDEEDYDIVDFENLKFYNEFDLIRPDLEKSIANFRRFLDQLLTDEKEDIDELMQKSARERCEWLVDHNRWMIIRDIDWEDIFTNIEEYDDFFPRYYPLFRMRLENHNVLHTAIALLTNDDLYNYSEVLAEKWK